MIFLVGIASGLRAFGRAFMSVGYKGEFSNSALKDSNGDNLLDADGKNLFSRG